MMHIKYKKSWMSVAPGQDNKTNKTCLSEDGNVIVIHREREISITLQVVFSPLKKEKGKQQQTMPRFQF